MSSFEGDTLLPEFCVLLLVDARLQILLPDDEN